MTRHRPAFRGGPRGRTVRVVPGHSHGADCWWCYYRAADGKRTGKPFPRNAAGRAEAIAFAKGLVEGIDRPKARERVTVSALWKAFEGECARAWRPNTRRLYWEGWRRFEAVAGAHVIAEDCGRQTVLSLVEDLERRRWSVTTIQKALGVIRQVYRWGLEAELLERDRVGPFRYRVAKDRRPESPDEYSMEEFGQLLGALPLDRRGTWRAHVALGLAGYQGARQNAVLHLQWADLEADEIVWRAAWDKTGTEWRQPLREPTRALLAVARRWRDELGYIGPWVFWAPRHTTEPAVPGKEKGRTLSEVYRIQTLWWCLRQAEDRAGIVHRARRAGHGLRRLLAGEVNALTGNVKLALEAIGDRDISMASRYLKKRPEELIRAFAELDRREAAR